jgi:hypothetical protein
MTFWQGLIISILFHASGETGDKSESDYDVDSSSNTSSSFHSANSIQHILICMEMLLFSIAHFCVFPSEEWEDNYKMKFYDGPGFGFKDFAQDVNLIINSGKQSILARREKKSDVGDRGALNSFGSINETDDIRFRVDENKSLV